ncbi:MAG: hypothetical protein N2578_06675 [Bdellovibrionaceae bacterium]|nr:hypothetical protein [Pseudobdellovibrionaceae bacterium]
MRVKTLVLLTTVSIVFDSPPTRAQVAPTPIATTTDPAVQKDALNHQKAESCRREMRDLQEKLRKNRLRCEKDSGLSNCEIKLSECYSGSNEMDFWTRLGHVMYGSMSVAAGATQPQKGCQMPRRDYFSTKKDIEREIKELEREVDQEQKELAEETREYNRDIADIREEATKLQKRFEELQHSLDEEKRRKVEESFEAQRSASEKLMAISEEEAKTRADLHRGAVATRATMKELEDKDQAAQQCLKEVKEYRCQLDQRYCPDYKGGPSKPKSVSGAIQKKNEFRQALDSRFKACLRRQESQKIAIFEEARLKADEQTRRLQQLAQQRELLETSLKQQGDLRQQVISQINAKAEQAVKNFIQDNQNLQNKLKERFQAKAQKEQTINQKILRLQSRIAAKNHELAALGPVPDENAKDDKSFHEIFEERLAIEGDIDVFCQSECNGDQLGKATGSAAFCRSSLANKLEQRSKKRDGTTGHR